MSSNNEQNNIFEKVYSAAQIAASILAPLIAPISEPSSVETQEPNNSVVEKAETPEWYESLQELSESNPGLKKQFENIAEQKETERKEKQEQDWETSLKASQPEASGSPPPEKDTDEKVDWVSLAMNSINSSTVIEDQQNESELESESAEFESEGSESRLG